MSLKTPPVITNGQPPKRPPSTFKRKLQEKAFSDAKDEIVFERSITLGILTKYNFLLSQPMSHSSSSQKDDVLHKGQVISVGVNTLFAGITPPATDPSYLSSITAPAVNVSPRSQGEIQADPSVFNDPLAKTQADDDEKTLLFTTLFTIAFYGIIKGETCSKVTDATNKMLMLLIYFGLLSRGRKRANKCKNQCCSYDNSLILGNHIIVTSAEVGRVADTRKSYHIAKLANFQY